MLLCLSYTKKPSTLAMPFNTCQVTSPAKQFVASQNKSALVFQPEPSQVFREGRYRSSVPGGPYCVAASARLCATNLMVRRLKSGLCCAWL